MSDAYRDIQPKNAGYVHTAAMHAYEGLAANPDVNWDNKLLAELAYKIGAEFVREASRVENVIASSNKPLFKKIGLVHRAALAHLKGNSIVAEFENDGELDSDVSYVVSQTYASAIVFVEVGEAFQKELIR